MSRPYLNQILNGRREINPIYLVVIEHFFGISRAWLETGVGEMMIARKEAVEPTFLPPGAKVTERELRETPGLYYPLPLVSGEAAAGPARVVSETEVDDWIYTIYSKEWCPNPTMTVCLRVRGDSMEPTIPDGGLVAIDRKQRDLWKLNGKIAAIRSDGGVTIKRIECISHVLCIGRPDNPKSRDLVAIKSEEDIIGKVVWWWGKG